MIVYHKKNQSLIVIFQLLISGMIQKNKNKQETGCKMRVMALEIIKQNDHCKNISAENILINQSQFLVYGYYNIMCKHDNAIKNRKYSKKYYK